MFSGVIEAAVAPSFSFLEEEKQINFVLTNKGFAAIRYVATTPKF